MHHKERRLEQLRKERIEKYLDDNIKLKRKIQGKRSCVSIQEISTNHDKFKNNVNIFVGDYIDKISDNFQNLRIVNSADSKYVSIIDEQLTFLVDNKKINKWYYFERLY